MSYGDAAYAGRSGQKESVVALASRFLTGKSKIGNEVATLSGCFNAIFYVTCLAYGALFAVVLSVYDRWLG